MGFKPDRSLYSRDPHRRRLQLANETLRTNRMQRPADKTTVLPEVFTPAPEKNAELRAVALVKPASEP